jgi:hypothetical protein
MSVIPIRKFVRDIRKQNAIGGKTYAHRHSMELCDVSETYIVIHAPHDVKFTDKWKSGQHHVQPRDTRVVLGDPRGRCSGLWCSVEFVCKTISSVDVNGLDGDLRLDVHSVDGLQLLDALELDHLNLEVLLVVLAELSGQNLYQIQPVTLLHQRLVCASRVPQNHHYLNPCRSPVFGGLKV